MRSSIKHEYPKVAEALEEIFKDNAKHYYFDIVRYRGYIQPKTGKPRRLSLERALEILDECGYEVTISVVTKADARARQKKAPKTLP